ARRVAAAFLGMVVEDFGRRGTIVAKYHVDKRSSDAEAGIHSGYAENQVGFGWTKGVFLELPPPFVPEPLPPPRCRAAKLPRCLSPRRTPAPGAPSPACPRWPGRSRAGTPASTTTPGATGWRCATPARSGASTATRRTRSSTTTRGAGRPDGQHRARARRRR